MELYNDIPVMAFADAAAWETWLAQHYELQTGVWIKVAKKASGIASVDHPEALDVALCYGWIDGQRRGLDETHFLQKFTPRRPRSLWSKVNIGKVAQLITAGRMQAPGLVEIERAQADGRWEAAYESQKEATVPPDLTEALAPYPQAKDFFESLGRAAQYAFLWRLMTAKTPETRARRLEAMVELLKQGKQFN